MSNNAIRDTLPKLLADLAKTAESLERLSQVAAGHGMANGAGHGVGAAMEDVGRLLALTPSQRLVCERIINVFETGSIRGDYANISIFADGPNDILQITYGRAQTTEYGNLRELVQMYVDAGGRFSEDLRPFLPQIKRVALVHNNQFKGLLRRAGNEDPIMARTQDAFFERRYFQPALKWASDNGFTRALSMLVIYDSFIHSGSILDLLRSRFTERPPAHGGSEEAWIRQYVDVRHRWLATHSRPILRQTIYRTRDLAREINAGNWDLANLPIRANGVPVDDRQPDQHEMAAELTATGLEMAGVVPFLGDGAADGGGDEIDGGGGGRIWGDEGPEAAVAGLEATPADTAAALAAKILAEPRIVLATGHVSGQVDEATAKHNAEDTAAGRPARRSNYGSAPGGTIALDKRLLRGLLGLAARYSFSITELAGGSHNPSSRHYAGLALDVNRIDDRPVRSGHPGVVGFMSLCRQLGATEVLGPGQRDHSTHVHAAWPRT